MVTTVRQLLERKAVDIWTIGPDETVQRALEVMRDKTSDRWSLSRTAASSAFELGFDLVEPVTELGEAFHRLGNVADLGFECRVIRRGVRYSFGELPLLGTER
jgi:hypothetical protein